MVYGRTATHVHARMPIDTSQHGRGTMVDVFLRSRSAFFEYRREADLVHGTALAVGFAALTGLAAQVRIPLPFTPVPITLQTFAVLLAGVALGAHYGGLSQALYVGLGVSGVPWFTGWAGGAGHLAGPTGGYLIGFVLAAAVVGWTLDRYPRARRGLPLLGILLVANFGVIHLLGLAQLGLWLTLIDGSGLTVVELLKLGSIPFIPGDLVKLLGVAALVRVARPVDASDGAEN